MARRRVPSIPRYVLADPLWAMSSNSSRVGNTIWRNRGAEQRWIIYSEELKDWGQSRWDHIARQYTIF